LGTLAHGLAWNAEQGGRPAMQRLALPFLMSAILHLLVLSQFNWNGLQARINKQHRLTVSLVPALPTESRVQNVQADHGSELSRLSTAHESIDSLDANTSGLHLDMNRIRDQVREYARQEFATSRPVASIEGNYFGSYTGDDSGIFFFHLDRNGHASGNGQSDTREIVFMIEGDVLPNGSIRMIGARHSGDSKFKGQLSGMLDTKTGKVSGLWSVPGILKGSFTGQHELQLSKN
jgi:hypothetical protein